MSKDQVRKASPKGSKLQAQQPLPLGNFLTDNIKWIALFAFLGIIYKFLSQRAPLLLTPSALPNQNPTCEILHRDVLKNCEDFARLGEERGEVLITCEPERGRWNPGSGRTPKDVRNGELFLWNYQDRNMAPRRVDFTIARERDFHPLGIDVVRLENEGLFRAFIVNEARNASSIEVVDFSPSDPSSAAHVGSVHHPKLYSLNSVAAVSPTQFFASNTARMARKGTAGLFLEVLSGAPTAEVVFGNINPKMKQADGILDAKIDVVGRVSLGNGVAVDRNGGRLWVAGMQHGVHEYSFDTSMLAEGRVTEAVRPVKFFRAPFAIDNLQFVPAQGKDDVDTVYVVGIPSILGSLKELNGEYSSTPAASWITAMPLQKREGDKAFHMTRINRVLRHEEWRFRSVFSDDGKYYGGVSTGVVVGDKILGVSVTRDGILVCGAGKEDKETKP